MSAALWLWVSTIGTGLTLPEKHLYGVRWLLGGQGIRGRQWDELTGGTKLTQAGFYHGTRSISVTRYGHLQSSYKGGLASKANPSPATVILPTLALVILYMLLIKTLEVGNTDKWTTN